MTHIFICRRDMTHIFYSYVEEGLVLLLYMTHIFTHAIVFPSMFRSLLLSFASQSGPGGSLVIMVNGSMQLQGEANKLKFSQCFTLLSPSPGNFYIKNDIFRINVG